MGRIAMRMKFKVSVVLLSLVLASGVAAGEAPEAINLRRTVTVEVVQKTKASVVNIATT